MSFINNDEINMTAVKTEQDHLPPHQARLVDPIKTMADLDPCLCINHASILNDPPPPPSPFQERNLVHTELLQLDLPNLVDGGESESDKLKQVTFR